MKINPQITQIAPIFIRVDPPNPPHPRSIFPAGIMTCGHTQ
jgi:hypothetical protein